MTYSIFVLFLFLYKLFLWESVVSVYFVLQNSVASHHFCQVVEGRICSYGNIIKYIAKIFKKDKIC